MKTTKTKRNVKVIKIKRIVKAIEIKWEGERAIRSHYDDNYRKK